MDRVIPADESAAADLRAAETRVAPLADRRPDDGVGARRRSFEQDDEGQGGRRYFLPESTVRIDAVPVAEEASPALLMAS